MRGRAPPLSLTFSLTLSRSLPVDVASMMVGAGLVLAGFVVGRLTAPAERRSVVYARDPVRPAAPDPASAGRHAGDADAAGEVAAYVRAGRKIQAVRRYRELHGTGLKEAKDAVDALEARLRP